MAKPPPFDPSAAKKRLRDRASPASSDGTPHPARALDGPRAATDHLLLEPAEIVPRVRTLIALAAGSLPGAWSA